MIRNMLLFAANYVTQYVEKDGCPTTLCRTPVKIGQMQNIKAACKSGTPLTVKLSTEHLSPENSILTEALTRGFLLFFALYGRFFVILFFAHIAEDIVLLALALKTLERAVERFVFAYMYCRHN